MQKKLTVQEAGHKGGTNRAKALSKERRLEIAVKASMASKKAREQRKLAQQGQNVQPV